MERAELDAEVARHARLREQFDEPGDLVETGNTWERHTNLIRFTSGCRALFRQFVSGVDDERVRWLLPRTYNGCCRKLTAAAAGGLRPLLPRAYGGTGKGKRRRDERVEGYFGWAHVGFARMVVSLVLPISVWRVCVSAWKEERQGGWKAFHEGR